MWLAKHVHHHCATGKHMAQQGEWTTSNYMLCHICIEDTNHITASRSSLANITRIDAALQATQKLQELDTDPDILTIFTKALCKPTNGSMVFSCPHTTDSNILLQQACTDQDQIGHLQFLQGRSRMVGIFLEISDHNFPRPGQCWQDHAPAPAEG